MPGWRIQTEICSEKQSCWSLELALEPWSFNPVLFLYPISMISVLYEEKKGTGGILVSSSMANKMTVSLNLKTGNFRKNVYVLEYHI